MNLDDLLSALREISPDLSADALTAARRQAIQAAISHEDTDLDRLAASVKEKSASVVTDEVEVTDEVLEELALLSEIGQGTDEKYAELDAEQKAEERKEAARKLAEQIAGGRDSAGKGEDGDEVDEVDEDGQPTGRKTVTKKKATKSSSVARKPQLPLGGGGGQRQTRRAQRHETYTVLAASDTPGFFSGQQLPGMKQLASAVINKASSIAMPGYSGRAPVATLQRNVPDHLLVGDGMNDWQKIEAACNERLLPGGSLVAALAARRRLVASVPPEPGPDVTGFGYAWCSPMEMIMELCPQQATLDGLLDIPTITTTKGGVMWPHTPDYSQLYQSFCFSQEDMDDEGFQKPCIEAPCPDGWDQCVLGACSVCVIDNILASRVDDAQVERSLAEILIYYSHDLNAKKIKKIEDDIKAEAGGHTDVSGADLGAHGPGMFESILSFLALQAEHLRTQRKLALNTTFEALLPYWARPFLLTDLSKKGGIQGRWDLTEADVDRWLASRGVRVQYVRDWQDASVDPLAPIGGATVPLKWPSNLKIIMYQAGAFVGIQGPSVRLDLIYDRELLQANKRVRAFIEDMWCVKRRCGAAVSFTFNGLCAGGDSGGFAEGVPYPCAATGGGLRGGGQALTASAAPKPLAPAAAASGDGGKEQAKTTKK